MIGDCGGYRAAAGVSDRAIASSGKAWPAVPEDCLIFFTIEVFNNSGDISAGLGKRRNAEILLHALRTRVVRRQCLDGIPVVLVEKLAQITCPGLQILSRVKCVFDTEADGGSRHQLH